jgi:hypothetical protein
MPGAINHDNKPIWKSDVGRRKLPHSDLEYFARAPIKTNNKNEIFNTVWLPVNASNRTVADKQQDLMHMKYAHINRMKVKNVSGKKKAESFLDDLRQNKQELPVCPYALTRTKLPKIQVENKPIENPEYIKIAMWKTNSNSMAPFASLGKPTCGYFFNRNVGHKKQLIGINATNTVKWRSNDILNIKKEFRKGQN